MTKEDPDMLSERFISAGYGMCNMYDFVPSPYLRRSFTLPAAPDAAQITLSALGFYELFVNGNRITRGLLSPFISNSDDLVYYDRYDLTPYLTEGENVIGLQLGNGMQNCFGGYVWCFDGASFRTEPKTALHCEIRCGEQTVSFEADESFRCAPSPIYYDDLRMGERYDARREIAGWDMPGFDDSAWTPAVSVSTPKGERRLCEAHPILPREERKPVAIWREGDDYIYDFGVNAAGLPRLRICGEAGQKIDMVHAEILRDGKFFYDNIRFPWPQYENYPLYLQLDSYTCRGDGEEVYMPRFTYHGFRYIRVSGLRPEQATEELLTYVIMNTDMKLRGAFSCSDPVVNRIQEMCRVSTLANFYHFPTDCPHREKNGWTADAALSAEQVLLNWEPDDNYVEWLRNIVCAQRENGQLPGIIPTGGWGFDWGNGPAWDSVLVELPYRLYQMRGDLRGAEVCADALRLYVDYIMSRRNEDGTISIGLGDWCAPHDPIKSPLAFTDSVECTDICRKASELFSALGRDADAAYAKECSEGFRRAVREHLCDRDTMTFAGNCQTSQAMAIYYGITEAGEETARAFSVLIDLIHENDDHLDTGVLGTRVLFRVLADFGETDLAMHMITRPDLPSYGAWVARGDTALCEDFNDSVAMTQSHNHQFCADVSAFFMEYLCGIRVDLRRDARHPLVIAPRFPETLQSARAFHEAPFGRVDVNWRRTEWGVELSVWMPDGMRAPLSLVDGWHVNDNGAASEISSGVYLLTRASN